MVGPRTGLAGGRGSFDSASSAAEPGLLPEVQRFCMSPHGRQVVLDLLLYAPLYQPDWQPHL
jgi:hypothetical protein